MAAGGGHPASVAAVEADGTRRIPERPHQPLVARLTAARTQGGGASELLLR
mgnify:CR=1 FL=1